MTVPDLFRLSEAGGVAFFDPFALHARLDFDFRDRTAANGPVLVHEYTHYLQSVSTVYGLFRVLDWIRTGVRLASVLPSLTDICIPLDRWWEKRNCPEPLRLQMTDISVRLGLNHDLEQKLVVSDVPIESYGSLHIAQVPFSDGEPHMVAVVPMEDGTFIPIGARALAEGMAASVQRMWEDEPRLDRVLSALDPGVAGWYTATRTVLRGIIGSDEDIDFVNAFVCDAAMMSRNPPASFIGAVAGIVGSHAVTRSEVMTAVREAMPEIAGDEIAYARQDITETLARIGNEEPFARGVRRLLESCLELLARRAAEPDFPVSVLCGDRDSELESLLQRYPLPVYFSGSTLLSWHDDEALGRLGEELLMSEHAMSILLFGHRATNECPLTASSSCPGPKTFLCSTAPWKITVADDGTACAFTRAMATLGALGKVR